MKRNTQSLRIEKLELYDYELIGSHETLNLMIFNDVNDGISGSVIWLCQCDIQYDKR